MTGRLEAVSPVAVLQRGYALVYHNDGLVRRADTLQPEDLLQIRFAEGTVTAAVRSITPENGGDIP